MKIENKNRTCAHLIYDDQPSWVRLYELACELAEKNVEEVPNDGWLPQMTCMPGVGFTWQWDSCFMAIFSKYSNGAFNGMNNLDNIYRLQREDGYISMAYKIETEEEAYGERVNPPLFAWIEWEYYLFSADKTRLARVYPLLKKYFYWMKNNRRHRDELYWYKDSGSSGMDNAPRGGRIESETESDLAHVDLACQQVLNSNYLSQIAELLNINKDVVIWENESKSLTDLINKHHWCELHGFYYDVFARKSADVKHNLTGIKTIASFWPIISQVANSAKTKKLVEHLLNPKEFWTPHPVPSLAASDPNYDPQGDYWLGGVWAPTNYMLVRGLQLNGYRAIAEEITKKHLNAMADVMDNPKWGGIWECYAPESSRPSTKGDGIVRDNFVGWSGIGPIAMFIENMIGLEFDAPENTIHWHLSANCRHGIKELQFNGGELSLICNTSTKGNRQISLIVENMKELNLIIYDKSQKIPVVNKIFSTGKYEFTI